MLAATVAGDTDALRAALLAAAVAGDADALRAALAAGADPDARDDTTGRSAAHFAAQHGHVAALRALIAAGASVEGGEELHVAAQHGHAAAVRELLAAGAPVDPRDAKLDQTPLHQAALQGHRAVVDELLLAGAAVGRPRGDGQTPLQLAAANGYADVAAALVAGGASAADAGAGLRAAAEAGMADVLRRLLPVVAPTEVDDAMVVAAARSGSADAVRALLEGRGRPPPAGALAAAAATGAAPVVEALLAHGSEEASDALFHAASPAAVRALLAAGANVNADAGPATHLQTPLIAAAARGDAAVVDALLAAGADAAATSHWERRTAADVAAHRGHWALLESRLLPPSSAAAACCFAAAAGRFLCPSDVPDRHGWTPLMHAAANGHSDVARQLLQTGSDPNYRLQFRPVPEEHMELLRQANTGVEDREVYKALANSWPLVIVAMAAGHCDIDAFSETRYWAMESGQRWVHPGVETPLLAAVVGGSEAIVAALLAAGADPLVDVRGGSLSHFHGGIALDVAVRRQRAAMVPLLASPEALACTRNTPEHLLADTAAFDRDGAAVAALLAAGFPASPLALQSAIRLGSVATARLLLEAGARAGEDALAIAVHRPPAGRADMVQLLLQHGAELTAGVLGRAPFPVVAMLLGPSSLADWGAKPPRVAQYERWRAGRLVWLYAFAGAVVRPGRLPARLARMVVELYVLGDPRGAVVS